MGDRILIFYRLLPFRPAGHRACRRLVGAFAARGAAASWSTPRRSISRCSTACTRNIPRARRRPLETLAAKISAARRLRLRRRRI